MTRSTAPTASTTSLLTQPAGRRFALYIWKRTLALPSDEWTLAKNSHYGSFLSRSLMNVPFTIPKGADVEKQFLSEATREGMVSC